MGGSKAINCLPPYAYFWVEIIFGRTWDHFSAAPSGPPSSSLGEVSLSFAERLCTMLASAAMPGELDEKSPARSMKRAPRTGLEVRRSNRIAPFVSVPLSIPPPCIWYGYITYAEPYTCYLHYTLNTPISPSLSHA